MSTGDMKNNLRKLRKSLNAISYNCELDIDNMIRGVTTAFLPILHYAFFDYSEEYSSYLSSRGYEFYGKSDLRFMDVVYRILVQEYGIKPILTKDQFFTIGYAEVKVIFVTKIVDLIKEKHKSLHEKVHQHKKPTVGSLNLKKRPKPFEFGQQPEASCDLLKQGTILFSSKDNSESIISEEKLVSLPLHVPQPHPDLAITPIKPRSTGSRLHGNESDLIHVLDEPVASGSLTSNTPNVEDFISDKDPGPADVSEVMIADSILPKCTVICHNVDAIKSSGFFSNEYGKFSEYHLNQESNIQCCPSCIRNKSLILRLESRLGELEVNLKNSLASNHELSARILLLETQVKLLCKGKQDNVSYVDKQKTDDLTLQGRPVSTGLMQGVILDGGIQNANYASAFDMPTINPSKTADRPRKTVHFSTSSSPTIISTSNATDKLVYSPVTYTDDEEIIKDFKPLRLSDVEGLWKNDGIIEDPFATATCDSKKSLSKSSAESTSFFCKVTTPDLIIDADPHSSFLSNSSFVFESEVTRQTVANLKSRFKETENLLKQHYKPS